MPPPRTDASAFANAIIERVLTILRDQADTRAPQTFTGNVTINPQTFFNFSVSQADQLSRIPRHLHAKYLIDNGISSRGMILGPIRFPASFRTIPTPAFGQVATARADGSQGADYTPFLVQPYVDSWIYDSGQVDGFMLGLYALTSPPENLTSHIVSWQMVGPSTRYKSNHDKTSWTSPYNFNSAAHISSTVSSRETNES